MPKCWNNYKKIIAIKKVVWLYSHTTFHALYTRLFVEGRVHIVHIFLVHAILGQTQTLAKALEVDDFPCPQEANGVGNVWVIRKPQDVVIGQASLLLCCVCQRTTFKCLDCRRVDGIASYEKDEFCK